MRSQFFVKFLVTFNCFCLSIYKTEFNNFFLLRKKNKKIWNWGAFVVIGNLEEAFVGWEFEGTWGSLLKIPWKLLKLISNMPIPCMYYILSLSLLLNLFFIIFIFSVYENFTSNLDFKFTTPVNFASHTAKICCLYVCTWLPLPELKIWWVANKFFCFCFLPTYCL